jgi:glutamyl-tRNA synthetase
MGEESFGRPVRVRFAPSPTGDLHVGNIRTALYNWAFARHYGGSFVFRLEDTDRSRSTDEACAAAIDTLRWLGLDWDEGPEVGGPDAPYRQSERGEIYAGVVRALLESGAAYRCYCTQDEIGARAKAAGRPPGYDNHCRSLTSEQIDGYLAEGRDPVVRLRMPEGMTVWHDLVRGEMRIDNATVPDFVLVRADGHPLYTLAVAVDDVLMRVTHIIRGEDLLPSTPRQMAVYAALSVKPEDQPQFGHLPMVLGADGQRLSKRNGVVSIAWYRHEGFLPEAMVNYLALLGWSLPDGREEFTLREMAANFDVRRVNRNPARFDMKKLEAINGDKMRALDVEDFADRITAFLQAAGLVATPAGEQELALVSAAAPLVQSRMRRLSDAPGLLGFLFVDERHFHIDEQSAAKVLGTEDAPTILRVAQQRLAALAEWSTEAIHEALEHALVDEMGLARRAAYGPVRVAVTGSTVSPPLFESIELLGRERTLARLHVALGT